MDDLLSLQNAWATLNPDNPVSRFIIGLMGVIFCVYVLYLVIYFFVVARVRVSRVRRQINRFSTEEGSAAEQKEALRQYFSQQNDSVLKWAWLGFDQSLISNPEQSRFFSTTDSQYFFNAVRLAPWLSGNRLMVSVPSMLVAIGVLGTFIGLVVGLSGLDTSASDTASLKAGIGVLIGGASIAFTTSIWGVSLSLLAGFIERIFERAIKASLLHLNNMLAGLFPAISSEQTLLHIEMATAQTNASLQNLHEKIGAELQKSVQDMSIQMQTALVKALEDIMRPAINSLVESSQQQSSEVLQSLVRQFMEGMNQTGQQQTRQMGLAANQLGGSLEKLSQITKASSEQNQQMIAQHRELTQHFERAIQGMRASSKYLTETSTQLGGVSRDLLSVSRDLGRRLPENKSPVLDPQDKANPYA